MLHNFKILSIFILFSLSLFGQQTSNNDFLKKIDYFKSSDNLEEYYYNFLDYYVQNKQNLTPEFIEEVFIYQWREPKNKQEWIAKLHLFINEAYYLKQHGDINSSILIYEKALKLYKDKALYSYNIINYCLKPLANNYTRVGDYKRAKELLKYTISLAQNQNNDKELIASYLNLSIIYQSIGNLNRAIKLLNKAIAYHPKKNQLALIYAQLAKYQLLQNNFQQAKSIADKSISLDIKNDYLTSNYATLASYYKHKLNYKKALLLLKDNLTKLVSKRQKAKRYIEISSVYLLDKDTVKSLKNLNKALAVLLPNFKPERIFDNPDTTYFYPENTIKEALDAKAAIFENLKKYSDAIECYKKSFVVEDLLRDTYLTQNSKLIQQKENRIRSEKLITLYDALYQQNKDQTILVAMLKSIESSKARVLLHNINKELLYKTVKEDSSYIQYQKLKSAIAILDNQIQLESLKKKPDLQYLTSVNKKKTLLGTDITILEKNIRKKLPLSDFSNFNFEDVKSNLLQSNHEISYFFYTSRYLFVFSITKNYLTYKKISRATIDKHIENFISLFSNGNPTKIENNISNYKDLAHKLHDILFESVNNQTKILTIIPDQNLNFIPFDALLTKNSETLNFSKLPYLVRSKTINYGFSLSILNQLKNSNSKQNNIIGFFPIFSDNHRSNSTLEYTKLEKEKIANYFYGLFLEKDKANKQAFLNKSRDYDIIHISTHANPGSKLQPAKIEFYDKTLYLPEIYGLQFQSDLIVLSACETGIGKLEIGEGVMSLSRGFSYAGIPNLVVSLWKVNDKSTSILMGDFYKHLKKTKSYSNALQLAKIDYLKSEKINTYKKNPYYWAGFIFVGNYTKALDKEHHFILYLSILIILIFLLLIVLKIQKRFNFAPK